MFRFTIRDVLLVMVIVGLAVGWSSDNLSTQHRLKTLEHDERQAVEVRSQLTAELVRLGNMVTVSGDGRVSVRPAPYLLSRPN